MDWQKKYLCYVKIWSLVRPSKGKLMVKLENIAELIRRQGSVDDGEFGF